MLECFSLLFSRAYASQILLTSASSKSRASNKAFDMRMSIKNKILIEYKEIKRTRSQLAQNKRRNDC